MRNEMKIGTDATEFAANREARRAPPGIAGESSRISLLPLLPTGNVIVK
jgi:hypothetical protein